MEYEKLANVHCRGASHGSYKDYKTAQAVCSSDGVDCYGVYDQACDNRGQMKLCKAKGRKIAGSGDGSCIYKKRKLLCLPSTKSASKFYV